MYWLQQILNMSIQSCDVSLQPLAAKKSLYTTYNITIAGLTWAANWPCLNTLKFPLIKRNYFSFTRLYFLFMIIQLYSHISFVNRGLVGFFKEY